MTGEQYRDAVRREVAAAEALLEVMPPQSDVPCGAYPFITKILQHDLMCAMHQAEYQSNGFTEDVSNRVAPIVAQEVASRLREHLGPAGAQDRVLPTISICGGKLLKIDGLKARDAMRSLGLILLIVVALLLMGKRSDVAELRQMLYKAHVVAGLVEEEPEIE